MTDPAGLMGWEQHMSEALKGLLARRADLERRLTQGGRDGTAGLSDTPERDELIAHLEMQLDSVINQIRVYSHTDGHKQTQTAS